MTHWNYCLFTSALPKLLLLLYCDVSAARNHSNILRNFECRKISNMNPRLFRKKIHQQGIALAQVHAAPFFQTHKNTMPFYGLFNVPIVAFRCYHTTTFGPPKSTPLACIRSD